MTRGPRPGSKLQDRSSRENLCGSAQADARFRLDGRAGMTRCATLPRISEADFVLVLTRGRLVAVLTEPPTAPDAPARLAPTLHALGAGSAGLGTAILLGPASAVADLSFAPWPGASQPHTGADLDHLAVAAALASRLVGRVLAEPVVQVAVPPGRDLLHLVPPRCWWHGTWRIHRRGTTARVAARLLLHGALVLG